MQPTYLPWAGYFNLMTSVDMFIFLDDVQLQKNSWHSRNRVLVNHHPHWITVPVRHTALEQLLTETQLCEEQKWRRKHSNFLRQNYARHPHKEAVDDIAAFIVEDDAPHLAALNMRLIAYMAKRMGIKTQVQFASALQVEGRRTERVLNILRAVQANEYVSPNGAANYLESDGFTQQKDIFLKFQEFTPRPYNHHGHKSFTPYLSVVDVIANLGWESTAKYVENSTLG